MMRSEFIERTSYEPNADEYEMIEQSYYEFDGNKDEFCKQWLKDKKDGHWDTELRLRLMLEDQKTFYREKMKEQEDNLNFYRPYFQRAYDAERALAEAQNKLERIQRVLNSVGIKEILDD